jgi:hypothetical protein
MMPRKSGYLEGGRNTDVGNIGRRSTERNSVNKLRKHGLSASGEFERAEKSSETGSDSVSISEFNNPRRVNGAPSICATTQTLSSITTHATPVAPYGERAFFKILSFMEK